MQFIADLLNITIKSGDMQDVSALGAAYMAGLKADVYENIEVLKKLNLHKKLYTADSKSTSAKKGYEGWQQEILHYKNRIIQ